MGGELSLQKSGRGKHDTKETEKKSVREGGIRQYQLKSCWQQFTGRGCGGMQWGRIIRDKEKNTCRHQKPMCSLYKQRGCLSNTKSFPVLRGQTGTIQFKARHKQVGKINLLIYFPLLEKFFPSQAIFYLSGAQHKTTIHLLEEGISFKI